ncbi:hypothetical protein B296_00039082 [Ensete ventricosum]|uniref:Uncharacterized protein n=1 Tax=Ensete ventricosum TaxID=4639 RepID=A0A426X6H9_ENSVE|nr:hypothetical protein B296_00039082 [Ensete ventricosum]
MPLRPTMPSYTSTTPAVLAVRHASTGKGIGLTIPLPVSGWPYDRWGFDFTCVRSAVRSLGIRPYLCQVGRKTTGAPIPASDQLPASDDHVDGLIVRGSNDVTIRSSYVV